MAGRIFAYGLGVEALIKAVFDGEQLHNHMVQARELYKTGCEEELEQFLDIVSEEYDTSNAQVTERSQIVLLLLAPEHESNRQARSLIKKYLNSIFAEIGGIGVWNEEYTIGFGLTAAAARRAFLRALEERPELDVQKDKGWVE